MRTLVLIDKKSFVGQKTEIEGAAARQLVGWLKRGRFDLDNVEVIRLGDEVYDKVILTDERVDKTLKEYSPDIIIGLGKMALQYLKGTPDVSLDDERGAPFKNVKTGCTTICTYSPSYIFKVYDQNVLVEHDFKKAHRLAVNGWEQQEYDNRYTPTYGEVMEIFDMFLREKPLLSVDIETLFKTGKMTCIGFAWSKTQALVVPLVPYKYGLEKREWTPEQELNIFRKMKQVLETCECVGQNAVHFDQYVLMRKYGILCRLNHDTMFEFWELYPSMDKSLAFLSSMLTDNTYWKGLLKEARSGKVPRWEEFRYNGLDCIVAYQCHVELQKRLAENPDAKKHYDFNIRVSRAYQYMGANGCRIDQDKLAQMKAETQQQITETYAKLTALAGKEINVKSPKQMKDWLYRDLGLPQQLKAVKDKFGQRHATETADALSVYKMAGEHPEIPALKVASRLRKLYKKMSGLEGIETEADGVCHWSFNCVGTKVGRSAGYKPAHEKGVQPQNVDKAFRELFIPPDGYVWLKADLEGADSVTMGACLKALGHPTLMDDINHRIKPAQTVALQLLTGKPFTKMSQDDIIANKYLLKDKKGKTYYKITKAVNHGSAYMLGFDGMSDNMLRISEGELYVSPDECKRIQNMLFERYDYRVYHKAIHRIMCSNPVLKAANGQIREFFGRADNTTCREMCSYLPQVHTAYVTNKVIERFYYDERAKKNGRPILKLCNQVHDELCGFIREDEIDEVENLFKEFCYVPLSIWGVDFIIEFEAQVGANWGNMTRDFNLYN